MKQPVYFPLYSIHSDLVKTALGMKDVRSVEKWLEEAGVPVVQIGNKKMVTCEDLLNAKPDSTQVLAYYRSKSDFSKQIDDLK